MHTLDLLRTYQHFKVPAGSCFADLEGCTDFSDTDPLVLEKELYDLVLTFDTGKGHRKWYPNRSGINQNIS